MCEVCKGCEKEEVSDGCQTKENVIIDAGKILAELLENCEMSEDVENGIHYALDTLGIVVVQNKAKQISEIEILFKISNEVFKTIRQEIMSWKDMVLRR